MAHAPAPLFRDPIYDGAADPALIWNRDEQSWWLLYTNRRANVDTRGVSWAHATDIGIAASTDGGQTWRYRGILPGLEFERGRNTFWAPEVLWHAGAYHMYVSYVPGASHDWSGARHIVHMTSPNLWDWRFESKLQLSSDRVIDAGVIRMPSGQWRMWFRTKPITHTSTRPTATISTPGASSDQCSPTKRRKGPTCFSGAAATG